MNLAEMDAEARSEALGQLAVPLTQQLGKVIIAFIGPASPTLNDVTALSCLASLGLFEAAIGTHEELTQERLPGPTRGALIRKLRGIARSLED